MCVPRHRLKTTEDWAAHRRTNRTDRGCECARSRGGGEEVAAATSSMYVRLRIARHGCGSGRMYLADVMMYLPYTLSDSACLGLVCNVRILGKPKAAKPALQLYVYPLVYTQSSARAFFCVLQQTASADRVW